ncbi:MAG: hypothetical protein AB7P20_05385 [Rhizobiaceae bacterium]
MQPELHHFEPSSGIPNSDLPLVFWRNRVPAGVSGGEAVCALYQRNGWAGTWIYGVFPFWHFHTHGHEVLTCVSGSARIALGGEDGIVAEVSVGDVTIIPAGVGHKRLSSSADFLMAGGYPPGQSGNIVRPGELDDARIVAEIAAVALPKTDPINSQTDGIVEIWRLANSRSV